MPIIGKILTEIKDQLLEENILEYQIEAEIIIDHALRIPPEKLYANLTAECSSQDYQNILEILQKRKLGIPLPYITKKCYFFERIFHINPGVFIPRPETELIIERCIENETNRLDKPLSLIDIGTGSGIIAISLKLLFPSFSVDAIDISEEALDLTKTNIKLHNLEGEINVINKDFRKISSKRYDLIVANLPYIPTKRLKYLPPEVRFEPRSAIDGGSKGIKLIENLIKLLPQIINDQESKALLEIDNTQSKLVKNIIYSYLKSPKIKLFKDLAGNNRLVEINEII